MGGGSGGSCGCGLGSGGGGNHWYPEEPGKISLNYQFKSCACWRPSTIKCRHSHERISKYGPAIEGIDCEIISLKKGKLSVYEIPAKSSTPVEMIQCIQDMTRPMGHVTCWSLQELLSWQPILIVKSLQLVSNTQLWILMTQKYRRPPSEETTVNKWHPFTKA